MSAIETQPAARARAIAALLCDLAGMKPRRSFIRSSLLALLVAGSAISLRAQDAAAETNAAAADAVATHEAGTTNNVHNTSVAAEPERKPAAASGRLDYSSFKIVTDRNIFNGNRSGQRMTATRSSTQQRSVRVEAFSLVGTLLSEDKDPVAFFDGTGSEFRKALKTGGSIAGFTVKEILHAGVRLANGTNTLDVFVGTGMRREDEGLWKSSTSSANYASSSSSRPPSSDYSSYESRSGNNGRTNGRSNGNGSGRGNNGNNAVVFRSGGESQPPTDAAEILKRLMEKREKE